MLHLMFKTLFAVTIRCELEKGIFKEYFDEKKIHQL